MNNPEQEHHPAIVELIAPDGLGFGEGSISAQPSLEQGDSGDTAQARIRELLREDTRAFRPVEADDDGCGDGRPWVKVIQQDSDSTDEQAVHVFASSQLRAKVFGGGLATAASMWRTIHGAPEDGQTVAGDRALMARQLAEAGLHHGAHSDDHAHGDNCGCGAIDKYPMITANAIKYRQPITGALEALYGDEFADNAAAIEQAFDVYESLATDQDYFADASGAQAMEQLLDSGAVVKELAGQHREETIVLNTVEGTTLDQQYVTETVQVADDRVVQAFSVDVWRGKVIAETVAEVAQKQDQTIDTAFTKQLAYADFLIRTLAVAGTLTSGNLPVYRRRPESVSSGSSVLSTAR